MPKQTLTNRAATKRAAQQILKSGLMSYAELAALSGKNRQTIRLWSQQLGAESAHQDYLEKIWAQVLRQVSK